MLKRLFLALVLAVITSVSTTARAEAVLMDHQTTKNLVRLSLWYEGAQNFDKSAFRPEAAEELLKSAQEAIELEQTGNTPVITEELAVALEKINI